MDSAINTINLAAVTVLEPVETLPANTHEAIHEVSAILSAHRMEAIGG